MKALGSSLALAVVGVSSVIGTVALLPTSATAEIPMKISQAEEMFMLTVPDKDTTQSAYGGKLRRYDVHIAKMFEVTQQICIASNGNAGSVLWRYTAGNGTINMGTFRIECEDADGVAMMVGVGKPQSTTIYRSSEGGARDSVVIDVLPLDFSTDAKVSRWQTITRSFKPIR